MISTYTYYILNCLIMNLPNQKNLKCLFILPNLKPPVLKSIFIFWTLAHTHVLSTASISTKCNVYENVYSYNVYSK